MLHLNLVKVEANNRENLLNALVSLGDVDCDFNGENGLEYLWDEVWKANGIEDVEDYENQMEKYYNSIEEDEKQEEPVLKYESNIDWLYDYVKDIESDVECVETFINTWMEHDANYYFEYKIDYIKDENGNLVAIAFAVYGD